MRKSVRNLGTAAALFVAALAAVGALNGWLGKLALWILAWPLAIAIWLFPAPCFDRGPGVQPFCEGTPVQIVTWGAGLLCTFLWYATLVGVSAFYREFRG